MMGLAAAALVQAQSLVPDAAKAPWIPIQGPGTQNVGVPGGIPSPHARSRIINVVTDHGAPVNDPNASATTAIQAAIDAAPPDSIVFLPAGVYRLDLQLNIKENKRNITLRGAGVGLTILDCRTTSTAISVGTDAKGPIVGVNSGLGKGSTTLTVADASSFVQGQLITIEMPNDMTLPVVHVEGFESLRKQKAIVVSKTGNDLTISPGLYDDYPVGTTAQGVFVSGNPFQVNGVGIENLTIDCTKADDQPFADPLDIAGPGPGGSSAGSMRGTSNGVVFRQAYGCWIQNVRIKNALSYGVYFDFALNCEMRRTFIDELKSAGTNGAGLLVERTSGSLFEDNIIFRAFPLMEINFGTSGNVFSYNFTEDSSVNGAVGSGLNTNHGPHNHFNLYEGNIVPNFQADGFFGSASDDIILRNWAHGTVPGVAVAREPILLQRFTRNYSVLGNLLGKRNTSGAPIPYFQINGPQASGPYSFGLPNIGNNGFNGEASLIQPNKLWRDWNITGTVQSRASNIAGIITVNGVGGLAARAADPNADKKVVLHWGSSLRSMSIIGVTGNDVSLSASDGNISGTPVFPNVGTTVRIWAAAAGFQEKDLDVQATTLLRMNYNVGATSSNIPAGEQLQGAETLPESLYLPGKPNWFGTLTWPAFNPNNPRSDILNGTETTAAGPTALSITATSVAATNKFTTTVAHNLLTGTPVRVEGNLPTGVTAGTTYYVRAASSTSFYLFNSAVNSRRTHPTNNAADHFTGVVDVTSDTAGVAIARPRAAAGYAAIPAGYRFVFGEDPPTPAYFITNGNPLNRTVTAPAATTFAVAAEGTAPLTVQWQVKAPAAADFDDIDDGGRYSGATTQILTISDTAGLASGTQYRAIIGNTLSGTPHSATSTPATLTINTPPTITSQPTDQTVVAGTNATSFTVAATGTPTPNSYTWQVATAAQPNTFTNVSASANYADVTTASLKVNNAPASFHGNRYRAIVSNGINPSAESNAGVLTVHFPPTLTNPTNQTIGVGGNISFSVTSPTGNPAVGDGNFQWQISPDGTSNWTNLTVTAQYPNVTNATLNIVGATADLDGKFYRAIATNAGGASNPSGAARLTVTSIPASITVGPVAYFVAPGYPTLFSVTAAGSAPLSYEWQVSVNNGPFVTTGLNAAPYTGQGTNTLTIANVDGLGGNRYQVKVWNTVNPTGVTSTPALLTISADAVSFPTGPANASVANGGNTSFTVTPSGTPTPTLQWQRSTDNGATWSDIANGAATGVTYGGVTTATLGLTGVQTSLNNVRYRVRGSNNLPSSAVSASATLTVTGNPPTIATQPVNRSVVTPASTTFAVTANGSPTLAYQWQTFSGGLWVNLQNNSTYSGVTGNTLTVTTPAVSLSGTQYRVIVSNGIDPAATSNTVTLTVTNPVVNPPPPPPPATPTFTVQPGGQTAEIGGEITFTASATGGPTYQWFHNNQAIPGATSSTLVRSNIQVTDSGGYRVVATNSAGSTSSATAQLNVTSPPVITAQPASQTVASGTNVTFTVTAVGFPALTYQWRKDGANLTGATATSLSLSNVQAGDAGGYDVVVTNTLGSATSNPAVLAINLPSYAGTYFGSFSGGGSWALYVRNDNTATYIATLPDRASAIVIELTINGDGTFSVAGTEISSRGAGSAGAGTPPIAAAGSAFTLSGAISGGQVTGELAGLGQTLSGSADSSSGPASNVAGFYKAAALVTASGTTYSIVGASGQTLVVTTSATIVDGASGMIGADGQFTANTMSGGQVTLNVNAGNQKVAASYKPAGSNTTVDFAGLNDSVIPISSLVNLSVRSSAGTGENTLTAGFVLSGGADKTLLVRGVGPTLVDFQVPGFLLDPTVSLLSGSTVLATNDNWSSATNAAEIVTTSANLGAFPLPQGSLDAVVMVPVQSGKEYTAQIAAKGATGVALLEVYDAAASNSTRLINMSARTLVGGSNGVLIVGFVVNGNVPKQILVRAIGPGLTDFGVAGVLVDPQLELYRRDTRLQQNDNWGGSATLADAFARAGAFDLKQADSRDAALLVTLEPGDYTAVVSGVGGGTGVALVEVYILP